MAQYNKFSEIKAYGGLFFNAPGVVYESFAINTPSIFSRELHFRVLYDSTCRYYVAPTKLSGLYRFRIYHSCKPLRKVVLISYLVVVTDENLHLISQDSYSG